MLVNDLVRIPVGRGFCTGRVVYHNDTHVGVLVSKIVRGKLIQKTYNRLVSSVGQVRVCAVGRANADDLVDKHVVFWVGRGFLHGKVTANLGDGRVLVQTIKKDKYGLLMPTTYVRYSDNMNVLRFEPTYNSYQVTNMITVPHTLFF